MAKIQNMRDAYKQIYQNMPIKEFIALAGYPDSINGTLDEGIVVWESGAWKGIIRGGTIYRRIILFTKEGRIVQFTSENLNVSNW